MKLNWNTINMAKKVKDEKYYFDDEAADRVVRFIETMCLWTSGNKKGQPIQLEPFQKEILREAFGWKNKKTGYRKHKFIYLEVPKGNGKSYLLSAICLYLLCFDNETRGEVFAVAGNREQARIVFEVTKQLVQENAFLSSKFDIFRDSVFHKKSVSSFKVLSSDEKGHHGYRPHGIAFDELHVQPNRDLYDTLSKGIIKKNQGMVWMITTAGKVGTFAHDMHEYAANLIAGKVKNDNWLARIYAADPTDDPLDEKTWAKANPGYGTIINPDNFSAIAEEAKTFPSSLTAFKQLHLNIWTGSSAEWLADHEWQACDFGQVTWEELRGKECWGGLDLASTRDTTCLHYFFPDINGKGYCLPFYFIPAGEIENKTRSENSNYRNWINDGYMIATPGNATDYAFIKQKIEEIALHCNVRGIAYDRFNSSHLVGELISEGINMLPFGQGFGSMSSPSKQLERLVIDRQINHAGHPVTRWQMGNVKLDYNPAGDIKVTKESGKAKVDGIVALVMAIGEYMLSVGKKTTSIYEERGLLVF